MIAASHYTINIQNYTLVSKKHEIVWVRSEEGYNETEGQVKSFLVRNEWNLSCYDIKTSV